jgi:serine/threonine protein kinase
MVYRAQHQFGRVVAVKVLPPSKARAPSLARRFHDEANLARRFNHPNVVRTLDDGEDNGLHFLVMEYLEGHDLQEVLDRRGRLPVVEAVRIVHQALLGLQYLSEFGLVHRNLEPANLMLLQTEEDVRDDPGPRVKLLDISLSRACLDEAASAHLSHPRWPGDGSVPGAPAYMAPEQARAPHDADLRADIYSLGCILYHALAGRPPFVDADPLRLMIRHATERPPSLETLNPDVPDGLARIVGWMMAGSPSQRYRTAERAAAALEAYLLSGTSTPRSEVSAPEAPVASPAPEVAETNSPPSPPPDETPPIPPATPPSDPAASPQLTIPDGLQPTPEPGRIDVKPVVGSKAEWAAARSRWQPTRRDCLYLLLGAVGLLLAQVIGWLLARLVTG